MALADTAKLVASLELKDKFSKTAAAANASLSGLERKTSTLSKIGSQASAGVGSAVRNIKLIGLAAAGAIAVAIKQGLDSLASIQKEEVQTQTVLKSTAGIAGQTFATITARSKEWSAAIGVNQEDVQHLQNVLLTFTNIGPTIFDETTTAALNLSQALGQDLQSSAVQLGKAINDPIKGMTALRRVGVSFTAEQVAQVKAMVKAGKTLDAQRLILRELNTEFGGSAEAFGKTAAGQFEIFKQNVQAAERQLATAFLPLLLKLGQEANKILGDKGVQEGIKNFGSSLAGGISDFVDILKGLPWGSIGSAFKLMGSGAKIALDAFKSAPPWLQTAVLTGWGLNKLTGGALGKIAVTLGSDVLGSFIKRGGTPATPLFVADVTGGAGKVLGGGAPVAAAAGKGLLATVVPYAAVAAGGVIIGKEVAQYFNDQYHRSCQGQRAGGVQAEPRQQPAGPHRAYRRASTPSTRSSTPRMSPGRWRSLPLGSRTSAMRSATWRPSWRSSVTPSWRPSRLSRRGSTTSSRSSTSRPAQRVLAPQRRWRGWA